MKEEEEGGSKTSVQSSVKIYYTNMTMKNKKLIQNEYTNKKMKV